MNALKKHCSRPCPACPSEWHCAMQITSVPAVLIPIAIDGQRNRLLITQESQQYPIKESKQLRISNAHIRDRGIIQSRNCERNSEATRGVISQLDAQVRTFSTSVRYQQQPKHVYFNVMYTRLSLYRRQRGINLLISMHMLMIIHTNYWLIYRTHFMIRIHINGQRCR